MGKIKNIVGQRFGRLVVDSMCTERGNRRQIRWNCFCDCGNKHSVTGESLRSGKSKSCGCLLIESRKSKLNREEALYRNLYSHIKTRYKKKYGDKVLEFEKFVELSKQNCHYCNSSPSHFINDYRHDKEKRGRAKKVSDAIVFYNGLDRIDSNIGYVENNVVPCCKRCNIAKLNFDYHSFLNWIEKVYKHIYK